MYKSKIYKLKSLEQAQEYEDIRAEEKFYHSTNIRKEVRQRIMENKEMQRLYLEAKSQINKKTKIQNYFKKSNNMKLT